MIYVNLNSLRPGQSGFDSTITHELQHMANFSRCPSQEGWLDEGASELAMRVAGYEGGAPAAFAAHPDVQLTAWTDQPADLTRHYQASYLFLRYVAERGGGWDALPDILSACARGENLFASYLARNPDRRRRRHPVLRLDGRQPAAGWLGRRRTLRLCRQQLSRGA